jgi:flagellar motor switch protein FliM
MASVGSPAETQAFILERLVGETAEPERVIEAAQHAAGKTTAAFAGKLADELAVIADVEIDRIEIIRLPEAVPASDSFAAAVATTLAGVPDQALLTIDADALGLIVALCFGSDPEMLVAPMKRDPSPLELEVATGVFALLATALTVEGSENLALTTPLPAATAGAELKRIALRDLAALKIVYRISAPAGKGEISLSLPQRAILKGSGAQPADGQSDAWGARFGEEVMRSTIDVVASMDVGVLTLGQLSALAVGHVIPFDKGAQHKVTLTARGRQLFVGDFGKLGETFTVRVRDAYTETTDIIEDVLPAARGRQ